jgi:hypothetical protein
MRPHGAKCFAGLALATLLSGCGLESYENRLKAANAYYAYREDLDTNLDKKWIGPFGISLRVPIGFKEIPAPKKDMPDDRVNSRFTRVSELPGLLAKWEMPVQTDDAGTQVAELFLLGNHQRFLDYDPQNGDGGSPATFVQDLDAQLQAGLNITLAPAAPGAAAENAWLPGRVPVAGTIPYSATKNFDWVKLAPPESGDGTPHRIGYVARYEVPISRAEKLQVALLCMYPARTRDASRLQDRLTKTMEQLEVPPQKPIKPKAGQKPGAVAPKSNF